MKHKSSANTDSFAVYSIISFCLVLHEKRFILQSFVFQHCVDRKRVCCRVAYSDRQTEGLFVLHHQPGLFRPADGRLHDHYCVRRRPLSRQVGVWQEISSYLQHLTDAILFKEL